MSAALDFRRGPRESRGQACHMESCLTWDEGGDSMNQTLHKAVLSPRCALHQYRHVNRNSQELAVSSLRQPGATLWLAWDPVATTSEAVDLHVPG